MGLAILGACLVGNAEALVVGTPTSDGIELSEPTARVAQSNEISLEQAIEMARRQHAGQVVRAETKVRNGRRVHEIRILGEDGRVRTVRINAVGSAG